MQKLKKPLKKLNPENLAADISRVTKNDVAQIKEYVKLFIVPRLDFMSGEDGNLYFAFEDSYVETEWKDMISVHYINTSYTVANTVMRVHLFLTDEITSEYYVGCFTLRTIDDVRFMLSYIYPNWKVTFSDSGDDAYVMSYKKTVHIGGKEIGFSTYPLFVQDNAAVKCAEASMISMTQYLHAKYDYNKIRILNLAKSYFSGKTKLFPSRGLTARQMMEVFNYYNIPMEFRTCHGKPEEFQEHIDFCLESAIPVLLGMRIQDEQGHINKHVVQIMGHTFSAGNDEKRYIVYDDSGCFIRSLGKNGRNGFVEEICWKDIREKIAENSFLMYPMHERVYISYEDINVIFNDLEKRMKERKVMERAGKKIIKIRIFVVDNTILKDFLKNKIQLDDTIGDIAHMEKEIDDISCKSLPHYLWYCEFQAEDCNLIFFADPTYNNKTTKDIIVNHTPIISKNVLGLLEKTNG